MQSQITNDNNKNYAWKMLFVSINLELILFIRESMAHRTIL